MSLISRKDRLGFHAVDRSTPSPFPMGEGRGGGAMIDVMMTHNREETIPW
jgi:hypothetical protein